MTCRRTTSDRNALTSIIPTLAIALVAATATFVGAQSSPPPDASYDIVWEPISGLTGQSGTYVGINAVQGLKAYFPESGMGLVSEKNPSAWEVNLALTGFGHVGEMQAVAPATLSPYGNRVDFARAGSLSEWYINDPAGVQQWISLSAAPPDLLEQGGPLTLEFGLSTTLTPRISGNSTILDLSDLDGNVLAQYNIWQITSASGKSLPAELELVTDGLGAVTGVRIGVAIAPEDYPLSIAMAVGFPKTLNLPLATEPVAVAALSSSPDEALFVPANDECAGAITVVQGTSCVSTAGDSATATQSIPPSTCSGFTSAGALDVWYKFVATSTNPTIQVTGTGGLDSVVELRSGACNGAFVTCADVTVANGVETIAATGLTVGNTYFVRVYGWFATTPTGTFNICVFAPVAPANDKCAGALPLTLNVPATGTNSAAVNDYSITSPAAACFPGLSQTTSTAVGRDTVWSFTPTSTGKFSFKAQTTDVLGGGNLVLYDTTTCPAPSAFACNASLVASNRNTNTAQFTAAEEIMCQTLTGGTTYYLYIDESTAVTTGGGYTVEVSPCVQETEPNDTPATANTYGFAASCPVEGSIGVANNFDYFSIGAPAAGSRVFAIEDGVAANTADQRLRITTTVDTTEFDNDDNAAPWGGLSSNIGGRPLTGVASYIQVSPFSTSTLQEPYRLYAVVQPPGAGLGGSSATAEINDATNNTTVGANVSGNMFFSGTFSSSTDLDAYRFCAAAGDLITLGIDADPLRNLTPINPNAFLFDNLGVQLLLGNDADTSSSNTSGAGTLTATSPNSPGEAATWRARYTGVYFAGVNPASTTLGDYLYSIGVNCQTGAQQSVDLSVTKSDSPDPVTAGGLLTYTVTVANAGPNIALDANLIDALPAGTTFQSITGVGTVGSWSCTVPIVGTGGTINCTNGCFSNGGSFTFTITVKTNPCSGNLLLTNTATVSTLTADSNGSNNSATATTTVNDPGTCSDDNACTANDHCDGSVCVGDPPPACDDGNACTANTCNPTTGLCENPASVICTASDQCHLVGTCDPGTGVCSNPGVPDGTACNDNSLCTAPDTCQNAACVGANPLVCNDSNQCTNDACNPATGLCVFTSRTGSCDDGNVCTTGDQCSPAGFNENFDGVAAPGLPVGWTVSFIGAGQNWVTQNTNSDTAPNSAFGFDGFSGTVTPGEEVLTSPPIGITSSTAKLTFRNRWSFESATSCFDASVLEIKIGAGSFTGIMAAGGSFVTGGYTGTVSSTFSNPLAGQSAWCNNSAGYPAYLTTQVNLPAAAAGQTIQLRWRLGFDTSAGAVGQNIDTISITDVNTCQPGAPAPATTTCGDAEAPCVNQDFCDGAGGCHDNGFKPTTTSCTDGDACTTDDLCDGAGGCSSGGPTNCDDSQCCTNDLCDHDTGCYHTSYTVPPVITTQPSLGCALLWPPQHGYVDFTVANTGATASALCGIASITFNSCTSSQQENAHGTGDGNSDRDCVYTPGVLSVRAERDGACSPIGRSYSSTVVATDVCGNVSAPSSSFDIGVFHDRGHAPAGPYYSANPGSNQTDQRPLAVNGTYGTGCGNGTCGATGTGEDNSDEDPEMEINQAASISVGNLGLEKASGGNVKLTWTEPTHEPGVIVTRFHVYRLDPVTLFWVQIAEVTKQTNSFLDPVLNDGLNRQYKITAVIKP